jgi:hypothetical protein
LNIASEDVGDHPNDPKSNLGVFRAWRLMDRPQGFGNDLSLFESSPTRAVRAVENTVPCDCHRLTSSQRLERGSRSFDFSPQPFGGLGLPFGLAAGLKRLKLKLELPSFGFDSLQPVKAGISSRFVLELFECDALTDGLDRGFAEGGNTRLELHWGELAGFVHLEPHFKVQPPQQPGLGLPGLISIV